MRHGILIALAALLIGCAGGYVTAQDMAAVQSGDDCEAVLDFLGDPRDVNVTRMENRERQQWVYCMDLECIDRGYVYAELDRSGCEISSVQF